MARPERSTARKPVAGWRPQLLDLGYAVVSSVLDESDVEALRAAFPPETPGSTLHVEIDDETPHVDRWRGLVDHPMVAGLLNETLGRYEVRIHGRDPGRGAGEQGLHTDRPSGRVNSVDALTLIWMLDDLTADNGATRVVPRSHRGATTVPRQLAQPGTTHPDEVVILGHPGDVVIFDAHLWHSGRRNHDGSRRRVVQMTATRVAPDTGHIEGRG